MLIQKKLKLPAQIIHNYFKHLLQLVQGFAINPARDFGPRLVYSLLPRKNKNADWSYSWIPVLGPILGAILAGLLYNFIM